MIPINVPEEKTEILAGTFGCNIGSLPFTYLGLPVGTTRPKIIDFAPLIDRVERRLPAIIMFLNQGQRLTMVNSVLSSLPTYYMCTLKIPKKVIEHIDRARRHCLWRKSNEVDARSLSLAAWDKVCKPKHMGGLGIINLEFQNCALLMKHLDKFYNKRGLPWVRLLWNAYYKNNPHPRHAMQEKGSFWWRDVFRLIPIFRGLSAIQINTGDSTLVWKDPWTDIIPQFAFPTIFSFAANEDVSIQKFMQNDLDQNFFLPLSAQALQQLSELSNLLNNIHLSNQSDSWTYIWGPSFKPKKVYDMFFAHLSPYPAITSIWKSKCTMKVKAFLWLLFMDRLNTRDMLQRRQFHIQNGPSCRMCNSRVLEDMPHLFFFYSFVQSCWNLLGINWDENLEFCDMIQSAYINFHQPVF